MRLAIKALFLGAIFFACAAPFSLSAGQETIEAGEEHVVILDTTGFWRVHHTLEPPVIQLDDGLMPVLLKQRWLSWATPPPPADWMRPGFDDSAWVRGPARMACRTPYLARLCLRGKFTVTDPAKVAGLALSVDYHGGAAVYVNGEEVVRAHLPTGTEGKGGLAEEYPGEAFVTEEGDLIEWNARMAMPAGETGRRLRLRDRALADVSIPGKLLRKGVNVLAIELVRAPYDRVLEERKGSRKDDRLPSPYYVDWNTCELNRVQLTAAGTEGLIPNATRPQGLQVWRSDLHAADFDLDFGDGCEPVHPITLVGVRNGSFSGKVVVGSTDQIEDLRVSASDLKGNGATIPASAVRIRYGIPWGRVHIVYPYSGVPSPYPAPVTLLGGLADSPPGVIAVSEKEPGRYDLKTPGQPIPVNGAVVPVWVTITVPGTARSGTYEGQITIEVKGEEPVNVPVELEVLDWALPKPQDYQTWVELIQSPDTLAVEYGLDLWSDRHWELIAKSMEFLNEVGSRVLYVPLICHTNLGNEQSMVRWIRKGEDQYQYDFSVMDRYLDIAEKHMGEPKIVVFWVWDVYIGSKAKHDRSGSGGEARAIQYLRERGAPLLGEQPAVTFLDPATGETENVYMPPYSETLSRTLWRPLFAELRERMARRGLEKAMMLGIVSDARPTKEEIELFADIASGLPWVAHSHHGYHQSGGYSLYNTARIDYQTRVWHVRFAGSDPEGVHSYGWKQPELIAEYNRNRDLNSFPASRWRHFGEYNITGDQRGVGRIGADFWQAIRDTRGQRKGTVAARYPQSSWRNLDLYTSLLAPGPDGPVATIRYEAFREGIQECEARIFVERALLDDELKEKLGADLVTRCEGALDERFFYMWTSMSSLRLFGASWDWGTAWRGRPGIAGHVWFLGSGWQERSKKLYLLAAEVAERLERE